MKIPNLKDIFFGALNYPEQARPGYYLKKQQESGWDSGTFFNSMIQLYQDCKLMFSINYSVKKKKNPGLTLESVELSLEEITGIADGKAVYFQQVQDLYLAVLSAYEISKPQKNFTKEDILSLVEYALWFIRTEFKIQTKETKDQGFRPRTQSYFVYLIIQDGPFFNFPQFKKAVRELLIATHSPATLKHLFQKYYDAALEIVDLWNSKLGALERTANNLDIRVPPETVRVEFRSDNLKHAWWNDFPEFTVKKHQLYTNQDFALYASQIANLLASEVLDYHEVKPDSKKDFISDFATGIHQLLYNGIKEHCIKELLGGKKNEGAFRYWFSNWFRAKGYTVDSESEKGTGKIDLKVRESDLISRIIEFKGWWNRDKSTIIQQTCSYLTAFEGEGYIFMINSSKSDISEKYRELVQKEETWYIPDSWEQLQFGETGFYYYRSRHYSGSDKKFVYHFIFSVS